jgi:hypothetical protein
MKSENGKTRDGGNTAGGEKPANSTRLTKINSDKQRKIGHNLE